MNSSDSLKSSPGAPHLDEIVEGVFDTYRTVASDVAAYEDAIDRDLPDSFDIDGSRDHLCVPLQYWKTGRKKSRAIPALVAYEPYIDRTELDEVLPVLAGLDVLIMVLDELIDTERPEWSLRVDLAVNAAFSSMLSFTSIPDDSAGETVEAITRYLTEASRIPLVEREVQRKLADVDDLERAMELIQFSYAFRAKDISAFATIPGIVCDVDRETTKRVGSDLRAYRVREILFDDVDDVEGDQRDGTETPVTWLLATLRDPTLVAERIDDLCRAFEYSEDTEHRKRLRSLEDHPEDLSEELAQAAVSLYY